MAASAAAGLHAMIVGRVATDLRRRADAMTGADRAAMDRRRESAMVAVGSGVVAGTSISAGIRIARLRRRRCGLRS